MTNERLPPPTYILGRITALSDGTAVIQPLHQETALLYQQKIRALITTAEEYANNPTRKTLGRLLQVARTFAENT